MYMTRSLVDGESLVNGENEQSEGHRGTTNGNDDGVLKEDGKLSRVAPAWLAESTPNKFTEMLLKSDSSQGVKYLQTMVECLALLGKITAAGSIISQRLRPSVHDMITAEIKARAAAIEAVRPRVDEVSKLLKGGSIGIMFAGNHVLVGELMEAKANVGDQGNGNLSWLNDADINGATGGYSLELALTVIQSECQQLICDILRATPDAASADAAV